MRVTKLAQTLTASLARYEPEPLGVLSHDGTPSCSSLLEYLGLLINGEWQRVPLPIRPPQSRHSQRRVCTSAPKPSNIGSAAATRVEGDTRHQERVPHPECGRDVQPAAVGTLRLLLLTQSFAFLDEGNRPSAVAATIQSNGERR